jgi:alpha-1,3-glucan synthase
MDAQTLSRLHVCATLAFSQVIGSICVMVARATAPDRIGPGSVFPDASKWDFNQGLKGTVQLRPVGVAFLTFLFLQAVQWLFHFSGWP